MQQALCDDGADSMDRLESLCSKRGLRMTDQRRVIARVLSSSEDHPDVEEVYRRASAVDEKISLATVYRTLRLFEEVGIIERLDFRDGRSRFEEVRDDHHHHLIDLESGEVIEFTDDLLEEIKERIARELGYELVDHRLELYGVPLKKKDESA
jgi:Fur family ferric uptake transcriptional regulator